jgi:serine/threonine protein kinase
MRLVENLAGLVLASRWGVERLLGVGGGGAAVWSAIGVATRSPVALKVTPARDRIDSLRFERAARVAGVLDHPHVARVIEYDRVDNRHLLIMELIEGETLQRRLQRSDPFALATCSTSSIRSSTCSSTHTAAAWSIATSSRPTSSSRRGVATPSTSRWWTGGPLG